MSRLRVFSRRGCHLCEQLLEDLLPMVRGRLDVSVCDVDSRADWRERYDTRVPVVEYDGEIICQYHLDRDAVARILANHPA